MGKRRSVPSGCAALMEVCILFLPAIPAYLWMWPNLEGAPLRAANILTHLYVLAGTLLIGLRRWNPDQLGLNPRGFWLSLGLGSVMILGRVLVVVAVDWGKPVPPFTPLQLLGELVYYLAVVGFVQELLFRGLVYRAFEDWLGPRWALWGSSAGFVLWHIFGGGPVLGAAILFYGLIFGLMRGRGRGIWGIVLVHGAMDFINILVLPEVDLPPGRLSVAFPALLLLGLALIGLTLLVLWQYERIRGWVRRDKRSGSSTHPRKAPTMRE